MKQSKIPSNLRQAFAVLMMAVLLINTQISVAQADEIPVPIKHQVPILAQADSFAIPSVQPPTDQPAAPSVQDVLLYVCQARGYGNDCAKTLLGIMWNESSNRSAVIGDNGKARGYFQIHYKLHSITTDCAEDLVCSTNWTLDYLEKNSYPKFVNYAVQCHNGCNANNGYAAKANRNGKNLWNKPLKVKQTAPIVLPANAQDPQKDEL